MSHTKLTRKLFIVQLFPKERGPSSVTLWRKKKDREKKIVYKTIQHRNTERTTHN